MLETERLLLIPFDREHVPFLHRLWTDTEVRRYLWDDRIISVDEAAEVVEASLQSYGMWLLRRKDDGEDIGFCGLRDFDDPPQVEILYALFPAHWRQGLATEASREVLRYVFEDLGLDKVYAGADPPNETSFKVMERLGMTFDSRRIIDGREAIYYFMLRNRPL
ncbi:MAG TPA: GNAT family N-acetyltransferase [Thermoanaerobaculia bacterium]|nr:GNAT family N-acetyltransferase [Thermoanaerobaculia bacterium]